MVTANRRTVSPLIASAIIAAALAVPSGPSEPLSLMQVPILLALASGMLVSVVFTGFSTSGAPLNAFPFAIAMGVTLLGSLEAAFVFSLVSGVGSLYLESRQGRRRMEGRKGALELFASVFLLCRVLSLIQSQLHRLSGVSALTLDVVSLLILTTLATVSMGFLPVPQELRTRRRSPVLFNLIPLPMALPLLEVRDDPETLLVPLAGAVFLVAVVQLGVFLLTTRRRALERSMEMERALADLTSKLSSAGTGAAALKIMLEELLRGSGASRVTVTRGNLSMSLPVKPAESTCAVSRGLAGLTAVLEYPVMPLVSPERVDSFLTRTAVMLEWITVTETITRETWESIETLVLSLEKTDEKVAGFSKRVAETVAGLAEGMGFDNWSVNSLRVASLLHAGSAAIMGSLDAEEPPMMGSMSLPPVTIDALRYHAECWDGSGPMGLYGERIPAGARALAVGISWEKAYAAGGLREAQRAMRMGSGLIFDPTITGLLLKMKTAGPQG